MPEATKVDVLSSAERDVIIEGLELKRKSHERAARSSSGAIASAHDAAAKTLDVLIAKIRTKEIGL